MNPANQIRLLLSAYQCGPAMGSVSQIGWEWYRRLSRSAHVTLLTHVRNRAALEAAGAPYGDSEIIFVDTEWFARPLYRFASRIFAGSEYAAFMISSLDFFVYESAALRILKQRIAAGARWDIVHAVTPVTRMAASRLYRVGAPLILGPLNNGLPIPPGFDTILRGDHPWLYQIRRLGGAADAILGSTRKAAAILTATRATLDGIPRRARSRCIPMLENGVDLDLFASAPWPPAPSTLAPLQILFVGRLQPFKALSLLLDALAIVRNDFPIRLTVIGDGPMKAVWQAQAERLALGAVVEFQGARELTEVASAMRAAHVLCLPSVRESGGSVLLEAMAAARPVIAIAFGGPAEIVDDAVGRAVPPAGVEATVAGIAEALRDIVNDPDSWRRRGEEGRRRAQSRFSWDAKIDRALELYRKLSAHRAVARTTSDLLRFEAGR